MPGPFADRLILRALRASNGAAVAVSDEEITAAQKEVASSEGILPLSRRSGHVGGPETACTPGRDGADERVVLFNTGTGLKYL